MRTIQLLIDNVVQPDRFTDVDKAMTWAEMNSRPGQVLRLRLDYTWPSPADVDQGVE